MGLRRTWTTAGVLALAATAASARAAWGQTAAPPAPDQTRVAGISAGFAGGLTVPYCCPEAPIQRFGVTVQAPIGRALMIEGEWYFPARDETRFRFVLERRAQADVYHVAQQATSRTQAGVMSVLYRFGSGRLRPSIGVGLSIDHERVEGIWSVECNAQVPGGCDGVDFTPRSRTFGSTRVVGQIVGGVEVAVTKYLSAFAAARIDSAVTPYGGVRIAVTARSARESIEPDVRVVSASGERQRGRLVALTTREVILRQGRQTGTRPIGDVRRVEKVSHRVRNLTLAGAFIGYVGGYLTSCGGGDENDCWPEAGLMFAGIGAGSGALIGGRLNRSAARDGRDVLFAAAPRHTGIGGVLRW